MKLKLIQRKRESIDTESFVFEPAEPLEWTAGQYLHYVLHHEPVDGRGSDRWFTIASAPYQNNVVLTTRFSRAKGSSFKNALAGLEIGDSVEISDLDGEFTLGDPRLDYVMIAGGIGITPFLSMLRQARHEQLKLNVQLLYANRKDDIPFRDELDEMASANPQLKVHYLVSPVKADEAVIRNLVPDLAKPLFYVSGPEGFVENLGKTLKSMGVDEKRLKQDWFPGYS